MDIKPVKFGIISYGHFFRTNFVRHFSRSPLVEIAGVYNRGEERRKQAQDDGYWATGDLDELLARDDIEAVAIGSSNLAHKEQAVKAAEAGKHILCEKPLAVELSDMDEMVQAVEKAGVINHVNHPSPYTDRFIRFKALCDQYAGTVLHAWIRTSRQFGLYSQGARHVAVVNPAESGGWTFHHLCHALDDACILLNSNRAKKVYHINQASQGAPSEEIVNAMLTFDNGTTALLTDGTSIGGFCDMGVQGTQADIRMLGNQILLVRPGLPDPTGRPGNISRLVETFDVPPGDKAFTRVADKFAAAVRGKKNELLTFRFVAGQYRILNAMRESARRGEAVSL